MEYTYHADPPTPLSLALDSLTDRIKALESRLSTQEYTTASVTLRLSELSQKLLSVTPAAAQTLNEVSVALRELRNAMNDAADALRVDR